MSKTERRKTETALQAALVTADVLGVMVAMALAYGVRFHSAFTVLVPVTLGVPSLKLYLAAGLATAIVWVPLFAALGLYRPRTRLDYPSQFDLALRGVGLGVLVALAMTFFYRTTTFSRLVLPMAGILAVLLIPAFRVWIGRWLAGRLPRAGVGVVGSGTGALALAARLARQRSPGIRCAGLFCDRPRDAVLPAPLAALQAGTVDDAVRAARAGTLDRVIIALDLEEVPRVPGLIAEFLDAEIEVEWVPLVPS